MTLSILVALNLVAGGLPLVGLGRVFVRARRDFLTAKGAKPVPMKHKIVINGTPVSMDSLTVAAQSAAAAPFLAWNSVKWDLGLIGAGVFAGTVANIWSLYV